MSDLVTAHAPGQAILFGEHAVVYPGHSAIAAPTEQGATATCVRRDGDQNVITGFDGTIKCTTKRAELHENLLSARADWTRFEDGDDHALTQWKDPTKYVSLCLALALEASSGDALDLDIASDLPIGGGMGSSAAIAAAVADGVARAFGMTWPDSDRFELTLAAERFVHGRPSGIDPAGAAYRTLVRLTHNEDGERVVDQPDVKDGLRQVLRNTSIVFTGRPVQSTGEVVSEVRRVGERDASRLREFLTTAQRCTDKFAAMCTSASIDKESFRALIEHAGDALDDIGVLTDVGRTVARAVRNHRGAAKVIGAGGLGDGPCGSMLVSVDDREWLSEWAAEQGFSQYSLAKAE